MLDVETRRRIDAARDILVGKVPDPKSQVEQITIALIYKFMDDMDAENEEWGGEREYFAGEFERYRWANLVRGGLGGHEMLGLYAEAIARMPENPGIPPLFRTIFNNAFLPYRDPETLRLFLREIDGFTYDNSEQLGDAFEYLLSVLGAQGDAGQFLTPRHIIDFIVSVVDPQKDESILDPACGTAGFLISAYQHIERANDGALAPEERERLANNVTGYDISPDMVRLSLVNMYLHGFRSPHIVEYDTLTSEERWDYSHADVILANPPFMSPKGGIRPHKRFAVQSTRSEVLFVDYMAEHLTPRGRAGIIVPEGIIFQTQKAHTALRRMLVNRYLVAVVSLPAGVFNPYSGVKTSILILDPALALTSKHVAFFKVEADGYDLGAQRRPVAANDLPGVRAELREYLSLARESGLLGEYITAKHGFIIEKARIAESGDYNLSAERYRVREERPTRWPLKRLGDVAEIQKGDPITRKEVVKGPYPVIAAGQQPSAYHNQYNREDETITVSASGAYAGFVAYFDKPIFASDCSTVEADTDYVLPKFLYYTLKHKQDMIYELQMGMGQPHVYAKDLSNVQIPLPHPDVQREIVAEVGGYQRVMDGARAVVEGYRPHVAVDSSWPVVRLGDVCRTPQYGSNTSKAPYDGKVRYVRITDLTDDGLLKETDPVSPSNVESTCFLKPDDLLIARSGSVGRSYLHGNLPGTYQYAGYLIRFRVDASRALAGYLFYYMHTDSWYDWVARNTKTGAQPNINAQQYASCEIPLPPLDVQQAIVAELDAERALVDANRDLIARMESRIASAMGRVWGDG